MSKVSILWRILFILAVGYSLGTFVTIKYLVPPTTEISIGRIKIRGSSNTISDVLDVTTPPQPSKKEIRKAEREERREERKERREARKEARQ